MNMLKRIAGYTLIITLITVLAACGNSGSGSNADDFRTLTDAAGHEVKVPNHPKRIIAPFLEDPLSALGVKPVAQWGAGGVPQHYLQDQLKEVPVLDMNGGLKAEEALSYKPDLIVFLAPTYIPDGNYDQFAKIAPTFVLSNDETDWKGNLEKLGKLLNEDDAAKKAVEDYDKSLADAKDQLGSLPSEKTAVVLQADEEKGFALFGPSFYGGATLYGALGFKQPAIVKNDYDKFSIEALAQLQDVDYIFVISGEGRGKPPVNNPLWKGLSAVKAGHVYEADSGHWFNANPIANKLIIADVLKDVHE
ncbi:ABC transporter substrate-binding protein [Paenibacillus albus]|nr:ABC transporter substrate-binding protein [Paenibacillus albus]